MLVRCLGGREADKKMEGGQSSMGKSHPSRPQAALLAERAFCPAEHLKLSSRLQRYVSLHPSRCARWTTEFKLAFRVELLCERCTPFWCGVFCPHRAFTPARSRRQKHANRADFKVISTRRPTVNAPRRPLPCTLALGPNAAPPAPYRKVSRRVPSSARRLIRAF